jgi:hypothetical protein
MSLIKTIIDDDNQKYKIAEEIALQAGVLKKCEFHEYISFVGTEDITKAYMLANNQYTNGEHIKLFKTRVELTDKIKEVVGGEFENRCVRCAQIAEEN